MSPSHRDSDLYDPYEIALETLYDKVGPGVVIMSDEYDDVLWAAAKRAIGGFLADRPERGQSHTRCAWKYLVVKRGPRRSPRDPFTVFRHRAERV
jgi:hypothetical protein